MKKPFLVGIVAAAFVTAAPAKAHEILSLHVPGFSLSIGAPPAVYVAPPPVCAPPAVVITPPVVIHPRRLVRPKHVVVPRPVVILPPPPHVVFRSFCR